MPEKLQAENNTLFALTSAASLILMWCIIALWHSNMQNLARDRPLAPIVREIGQKD